MHTVLIGTVPEQIKKIPDHSLQCVVTSPPYYKLRRYFPKEHDSSRYEIGQEDSYDCGGAFTGSFCGTCYICHLLEVFAAIRPKLHRSGTVWVNLGDSYLGNKTKKKMSGKNLLGIPWRFAFAMQAQGWVLRSEIIWAKGISGDATRHGWSGSILPESVTDRCSKSHEHVFLFGNNPEYFYDNEAIKEASAVPPGSRKEAEKGTFDFKYAADKASFRAITETRNRRTVWTVQKQGFLGAHFATFPPDLIRPMILAGTSQAGCCSQCYAPYRRVTTVTGTEITPQMIASGGNSAGTYTGQACKDYDTAQVQNASDTKRRILESMSKRKEFRFEPSCKCESSPIPCSVLDPFVGSGTTLQVCTELGRNGYGIDIDEKSIQLIQERFHKFFSR